MLIGIGKYNASYLLSVIGISNIIGKICLGCISDYSWVNRLYLYSICLGICGLSKLNEKRFFFLVYVCINFSGLIASNFCYDYSSQIAYCILFGATSGGYIGLTSVVLIDLIGLESFIQAYGIQLLSMGIARIVGPPFIGKLLMCNQQLC